MGSCLWPKALKGSLKTELWSQIVLALGLAIFVRRVKYVIFRFRETNKTNKKKEVNIHPSWSGSLFSWAFFFQLQLLLNLTFVFFEGTKLSVLSQKSGDTYKQHILSLSLVSSQNWQLTQDLLHFAHLEIQFSIKSFNMRSCFKLSKILTYS